jgi:integration host factor subunit alpha
MALTKQLLSEYLSNKIGFNKSEAKEFVEYFFEQIRQALESGHNVKLSGFGNFVLRDKKARPGRNPKTGEAMPVSARRVVTFRASPVLKTRVENYAGNTKSESNS